jgi:TolA-binding protein
MTTPVRIFLVMLLCAAGPAWAQVAGPSPLASEASTAQMVPGSWMVAERRADSALQTGFPITAATAYRELLGDSALPVETRHRVSLSLVTALLDAADLSGAEAALSAYTGSRNTAYQLRVGLLASATNRWQAARAALAAGRLEDLPAVDRGWWFFLQASVADAENQVATANSLYEQAAQAAVSDLQRARFRLGQEQSRLRAGQVSEAQLAPLRTNMERFQGQPTGHAYLRSYATALAGLQRTAEAQSLLQRQLAILPPGERAEADQLRLLLGVIAGENSGAGRQAFRQLLRDAQRPETQQLALLLLVRAAQKNPVERQQLARDLDDLIAPAQHPIIEDLMIARAQVALDDKDYAKAEETARTLVDRYPGTKWKGRALLVRLAGAWDLKRYRMAVDLIAQLRTITEEGRLRAELGVLLAEAFFRSGDYRNAADAYAAALYEMPAVAPAGTLIFQRVLAEIRAEQLDAAARQLDEAARNPNFDVQSRWQAEWNLVKAMQVLGQSGAAQARVEKLMAAGAAGVPDELRVRLMWLRAKLSFDNNQPDLALRQADELLTFLQGAGGLAADLRMNVTSTIQLLKAQGLLALNREQEGLATLDKLRADFRTTSAAQYSYIVQANHLSQRGDLAGAQRVLISFVDLYGQSEYAPTALFEAAQMLEKQGLDRHLEEANRLLDDRLIKNYPQDELVFYARLKQGDLLRTLNYFPQARQVYEDLLNRFSQHPDILLADLALADTLFAQGANSVVNYESAVTRYERLRDLPTAPVDLRAEAGFKWGYALARRAHPPQPAKAQTVLWSVVDTFLLDPAPAQKLGAKGRYWVTRALLELGQLHEDAGRRDEAQRAYQLIIDQGLPGAAQAQAKLARFNAARPG